MSQCGFNLSSLFNDVSCFKISMLLSSEFPSGTLLSGIFGIFTSIFLIFSSFIFYSFSVSLLLSFISVDFFLRSEILLSPDLIFIPISFAILFDSANKLSRFVFKVFTMFVKVKLKSGYCIWGIISNKIGALIAFSNPNVNSNNNPTEIYIFCMWNDNNQHNDHDSIQCI